MLINKNPRQAAIGAWGADYSAPRYPTDALTTRVKNFRSMVEKTKTVCRGVPESDEDFMASLIRSSVVSLTGHHGPGRSASALRPKA